MESTSSDSRARATLEFRCYSLVRASILERIQAGGFKPRTQHFVRASKPITAALNNWWDYCDPNAHPELAVFEVVELHTKSWQHTHYDEFVAARLLAARQPGISYTISVGTGRSRGARTVT